LYAAIACSAIAEAQPGLSPEPPIEVVVKTEIKAKRIVYRYEVRNRSPFPVTTIDIGYDRTMGVEELTIPPAGWANGHAAIRAPSQWQSRIEAREDTLLLYIEWDIDSTTVNKGILPGKSLDGFVVAVPQADEKYEHGSWTAYVDGGPIAYSGVLSPRKAKPSK
jgi:hypothetical protein